MGTQIKKLVANVDDWSQRIAALEGQFADLSHSSSGVDEASRIKSELDQNAPAVNKLKKKAENSLKDPDSALLGPKSAATAIEVCGRFTECVDKLETMWEAVEKAKQRGEAEAARQQELAAKQKQEQDELEKMAEELAQERREAEAKAQAQREAEAQEMAKRKEEARQASLSSYREMRTNVRELAKLAHQTRGAVDPGTVMSTVLDPEKHELGPDWRTAPLGMEMALSIELALELEEMCTVMKKDLQAALDGLVKEAGENGPKAVRAVLRTLVMYVQNVISNPSEVEMRRIRVGNTKFQEELGRYEAGTQCMAAVGFQWEEAVQGKGKGFLVMNKVVTDNLTIAKRMIEERMPAIPGGLP